MEQYPICKRPHFLDLRSMTSPPAAWIAAVDPVAVEIHIPLDQTLNENICINRIQQKFQLFLEYRDCFMRIGLAKIVHCHLFERGHRFEGGRNIAGAQGESKSRDSCRDRMRYKNIVERWRQAGLCVSTPDQTLNP